MGTDVADRSASLRVHGGPSRLHFPPAAYRFIYYGPGFGAPHQPPRSGQHGRRMVGGIPAQLELAGFLPAAARCYSGTRVCSSRAWCGIWSEMALSGVGPAFRASHVNVLELFAVAVGVHCWGEEWHDTQILLHTDMPVVPVLTTGTCTCPHMSLVHRLFFFLAQQNVTLCRAARILTLICFLGPCRRWFRLMFRSGSNTTTSTAGKLRGCQHVTGLRVRPDFLSGGGDPSPVPPPKVCAGAVCGPQGYAPFRGHPQHILGRAVAFQLPFRRPGEGGGYALSDLCCAASNAPRPTASCSRLGDLSQLPP